MASFIARNRAGLRSSAIHNTASESRLTSRLAFATAALALMIATGFTIFDLALRTADKVFIDIAALTPPAQADIAFGHHRLSFPGDWLTSPLALSDEMATSASIRLPYNKLLALIGASSPLDGEDGTNPHDVVIRLQVPARPSDRVDLLSVVYIPKSIPVTAIGPAGLTMRHFLAKSGYDGETLYIGHEGGHQFIARCLEQNVNGAAEIVQRPCISTHRISDDLEAVLQFETALLVDWRKLDAMVNALVSSISVR